MANSKYEYTRTFERPDPITPNMWIVIRIDGRGFHKFSSRYDFAKPNDLRALGLMNSAAETVMRDIPDLVVAYGHSDEYSFVFQKDTKLFDRRESKLTTTVVSSFTANYMFKWSEFFPNSPLTPPLPTFDGRAVAYPSVDNLKDYLSWRQVDCHINNLYNTTFWALVQQGGRSAQDAEQDLAGTLSSDKNEILFSRFGINYNNEADICKKGTVIYRDVSDQASSNEVKHSPSTAFGDNKTTDAPPSKRQIDRERKKRTKAEVKLIHIDIIKEEFWAERPWILG